MSYNISIVDLARVTDPDENEGQVFDIITLADARNYLKQFATGDIGEEDLIASMITAARQWIERHIDQSITKKRIIAYTDELSDFELPLPPVVEIEGVVRVSRNGTTTALVKNVDYWEIGKGDVTINFGQVWGTVNGAAASYEVTYLSYMNEIPEILKDAARGILSELYYNRGNTSEKIQQVPWGIIQKLESFRRPRIV